MAAPAPEQHETVEEWLARGRELFGEDPLEWPFTCPNCKSEWTLGDAKACGVDPERGTKECIGRWGDAPGVGCDWASFGLFRGPKFVRAAGKLLPIFEFAEVKQ